MKKIIFFVSLVSFSLCFSQTREQRDKILKDYDTNAINSLLEEINAYELGKQERINNYLLLNPDKQKELLKNGKLFILHDILDDKPIYISSDNRESAFSIKTNTLYPGGDLGLNLEGENMILGVWETGGHGRPTHVEFTNSDGTSRVSLGDATTPNIGFHAAHVAGTVGANGVNISAKGMAPKSSIVAYNSSSDSSETVNEHLLSGMLVTNHSYGVYLYVDGEQNVPDWYPGCYINESVTIDNALYNNPFLLRVFSAGNSGTESYSNGLGPGLDKLTAGKTNKNGIIVANANIGVQSTPFGMTITGASLAPSSSQGPTDDGRIKPDIAARGTNVYSCADDSDTSYGTATGTSMAAPSASGTILLLQEHYNNTFGEFMKSSTVKALVCHTATDDADNDNVTAIPYPGPDPFWGWGLLNAELAAQTINNSGSGSSIIEENTLNNGETYSITVNVSDSQKLMATLCWTDRAGNSQYGLLNSATPVLVNDLDLRITNSLGNEFLPWKLDLQNLPYAIKGDNIVDVIERVEVDIPSAGEYTITISHKGNLTIPGNGPGGNGGIGPQDYSLVVTGANMTLSNPENNPMGLLIWPIPSKNVLNFQYMLKNSNNSSISLFDIHGRLVHQISPNTNNNLIKGSIDTSSFSKGMYVLSIEQGNKIFKKKVILQ